MITKVTYKAQAVYAACALIILLLTGVSYCQPDTLWTSRVRNAGSYLQVIRTTDGGYAVGTYGWGGDEDRGDSDFQIIKADSLGELEWNQFYAGMYNNRHGSDEGFTICQTPDGGYVLGGVCHGSVLIRTDEDGDTLWMRYYRADEGFRSPGGGAMKCRITPDGNIVFNTRTEAVMVSDEDGDVIWRYEFEDAAGLDEILCIEEDAILVAGYTNSFGEGSADIFVAKLDMDGNLEWQEAYGTEYMEFCLGLIETTHREYCIVGVSRYANGSGDYHPYILLINAEGELIWQRIYDDHSGTALRDLVETADGGFAVVGYSLSYRLFRMDYSGELLWHASYGGHNWEPPLITGDAYSIHLMEDGGYLLGGFASVGCFLIRTEPDTVEIAFELETEVDSIDFGEAEIDSLEFEEITISNTGRRYVVIDSLWFEGDSVFACLLETPFRIDPEDTVSIPVMFQPLADSVYTATLSLFYADESLEFDLTGTGRPSNGITEDNTISAEFALTGVYPNPFNSQIRLAFELAETGRHYLAIYDLNGREVASLKDGFAGAGRYSVVWNAEGFSAGLYIARLQADGQVRTMKLLLVK